jgi:hypothetical protein
MLKHVAKHNQQKAVIIFREVPNEEHMCLVVYSDSLPSATHDAVMKALESREGQATADFSEVLHRTLDNNGTPILSLLHKNGWIRKVPTNQVIVTPTNNSNVRLDELNKLIKELAKGEDAVKRLAELDANRGLVDPTQKKKAEPKMKEVGVPPNSRAGEVEVPNDGILSDADLAAQRLDQASTMKRQAEQLLAEAKRLEAEAKSLAPKNVRTTKKTTTAKKQAA